MKQETSEKTSKHMEYVPKKRRWISQKTNNPLHGHDCENKNICMSRRHWVASGVKVGVLSHRQMGHCVGVLCARRSSVLYSHVCTWHKIKISLTRLADIRGVSGWNFGQDTKYSEDIRRFSSVIPRELRDSTLNQVTTSFPVHYLLTAHHPTPCAVLWANDGVV